MDDATAQQLVAAIQVLAAAAAAPLPPGAGPPPPAPTHISPYEGDALNMSTGQEQVCSKMVVPHSPPSLQARLMICISSWWTFATMHKLAIGMLQGHPLHQRWPPHLQCDQRLWKNNC